MGTNDQPGWRSGNQGAGGKTGPGGADFGGADFGGPLPGQPGPGGGKRPWFGPKRIGWGYSPRTWQGWLVSALMVAAIIIAGAVGKGKPWFFIVVVAAIAVPLVIIAVQRPRR